MPLLTYTQLSYAGTPTNGVDEVEQIAITGSPDGGTFTITLAGETTAALSYAATAAQVQAALEALASVVPGDVACTGGPLPATPIAVTFRNNLGGLNVGPMTADSSGLTGGTAPAVVITTPTAGVRGTFRTAQYGAVLLDTSGGKIYRNEGSRSTPTWAEVVDVT